MEIEVDLFIWFISEYLDYHLVLIMA